jgi:hypothetical protein
MATTPPRRASAGLLADAAPVKVARAAVLALVGGAEGRLEMVLMVGMAVVAGRAAATDDDAGGAHVPHVAGEETAGAGVLWE